MASIEEAIRRLIFQYVSEGADKVMQTQEAVAASTTKTDKASLSLEKSFGSLERRYVDTVRHQQDYAKVQDKVNAAVAQNPALQERANVVLAEAAKHFDNLALNAGKGGVASTILGKAINTLLGPAGLMGAAMTGIGVAVGYMASQFQSASTTIEQALEEQNRLLKEAKLLIDAKTSAEQKMFAQSKALTQFQLEGNQRDLAAKLESAQKGLFKSVTSPTSGGMPEMGIAPDSETAFTAAAGYEKLISAITGVSAAIKAGQPGVIAFRDEIAKLATLNPELTTTVQELLKMTEAAAKMEQGNAKLQATKDALAGIATNAQLAAVGLGSIAQFNLSNLQADQAAAATERMAKATLELAREYPGISIEVAKQLKGMEQQLALSKARLNGTEELVQAEIAYTNAIGKGTTELEAQALVGATRAAASQREHEQMVRAYEQEQNAASDVGEEIQKNTMYTYQMVDALEEELSAFRRLSLAAQVENRMRELPTQFGDKQYVSSYDPLGLQRQKQAYEEAGTPYKLKTHGIPGTLGAFQYATPDFEKVNDNLSNLFKSETELTKSTDRLNETMQNALSPFYSQDPRTTKLGFRAGVTGNPDWATGATNANPLVAILGAGATAPGMADGGSFTVGGGYSANDNKMAVFPVASGEEIVVNRNKEGSGGQIVNIDNRIIVNGSVDDDTLSKMKVSRFQQAQRMRAGMAQAS